MPVIAIAPCSTLHDYEESIRRVGGDVRVLDLATDTPAEVVRTVDGLLLTGGNDVLPSIYGEPAHPAYEAAETGRDEFELELVRRAMDADLPVFAICRGLQVLNVARGGTLIQHLPDGVDDSGSLIVDLGLSTAGRATERTRHDVRTTRVAIAHEAWLAPGTLVAQLFPGSGDACAVNSRHHQAVKRVGEGLVISATAPDGVIEAVEDPAKRFCVGVQWHPENFYRTGDFRPLFDAFVTAARR